MPAKTTSPVSRSEFHEKAEPVKITINGFEVTAEPREFSTGSFGWYFNGKAPVSVGGKNVTVQVGLNMIVVGSKDLPREGGGQAAG